MPNGTLNLYYTNYSFTLLIPIKIKDGIPYYNNKNTNMYKVSNCKILHEDKPILNVYNHELRNL